MKIKISGHTCPFPGSLPHGNWSCEMQEIPIQGTSFLDEDAQSYRGEEFHLLVWNRGTWCNLMKSISSPSMSSWVWSWLRCPADTSYHLRQWGICKRVSLSELVCHYLSLSHTRSTIVTLSLNWFQIWPTDCATCIAQYYPIVIISQSHIS